jgi:hypothetical protein
MRSFNCDHVLILCNRKGRSDLLSPEAPGVVSVSISVPHPPSCVPFAPCPLRDFLATMDALTPVVRLFGTPRAA